MKIYFRDGSCAEIRVPEGSDNIVVAQFDVGGYIHINQKDRTEQYGYTRITVSKENVLYIDYENDGMGKYGINRMPIEFNGGNDVAKPVFDEDGVKLNRDETEYIISFIKMHERNEIPDSVWDICMKMYDALGIDG